MKEKRCLPVSQCYCPFPSAKRHIPHYILTPFLPHTDDDDDDVGDDDDDDDDDSEIGLALDWDTKGHRIN